MRLEQEGLGATTVGTVDSNQGSESDVVIISFVRSSSAAGAGSLNRTGFLRDFRRLNVSITRAKSKLIVIGDLSTLSSGAAGPLSALVSDARSRSGVVVSLQHLLSSKPAAGCGKALVKPQRNVPREGAHETIAPAHKRSRGEASANEGNDEGRGGDGRKEAKETRKARRERAEKSEKEKRLAEGGEEEEGDLVFTLDFCGDNTITDNLYSRK